MNQINPNGTAKPIVADIMGNKNNAPIVGRYQESQPIEGPKNTANLAAINAEGQRNNNARPGTSKSQTPFS